MRIFNLLLIYFILSMVCVAQEKDEYRHEFTWGLNKNSSGGLLGGFVFKISNRKKDTIFESYGLEIVNVKSDLEVRGPKNSQGRSYWFGKSNYLFAFRFQYGRDILLYRKSSKQGAEIKACFAAGPSLGIVAPYYIVWINTQGFSVHEQYDYTNTNHTLYNIYSRGNDLEGFGNSKFEIGANIKAALHFEMGVSSRSLTGFEVGFLLDMYTSKIPLVPAGQNRSVFPTVFINFFYGWRK